MAIATVGLLSPGDMGHTVGRMLHDRGLRVVTCFEGRSPRSRELAKQAGIEDGGTLETVVSQSDIFLSIVVPSAAVEVAERVATAMQATQAELLYIDCNAVSPGTVGEVSRIITNAGGRVADVGIFVQPSHRPGIRFYASGPGAEEAQRLREYGLDMRIVGPDVGQASALKMCYGALTKGLQALAIELLVTAEALGLADVLAEEQGDSVEPLRTWLEQTLPGMPPKAYRWVSEMEEIARMFEEIGLTPSMFTGAADVYRFVAGTDIGKETPENRDPNRGLSGIVHALTSELSGRHP